MGAGEKLTVRLGALAPPLAAQLGVPAPSMLHHQADLDAITRLAVRGLLPERQVVAARRKVLKNVASEAWSVSPAATPKGGAK